MSDPHDEDKNASQPGAGSEEDLSSPEREAEASGHARGEGENREQAASRSREVAAWTPQDAADFALAQFDQLRNGSGKEKAADIAREMKEVMFDHVSVFRVEEGMRQAVEKVRELKERFKEVRVQDQGKRFNTEIFNTWEISNLLDLAEVTAVSAVERTESRGAHARDDYKERDDENWLKHTMAWLHDDGVKLDYMPVVITKFQPKARSY